MSVEVDPEFEKRVLGALLQHGEKRLAVTLSVTEAIALVSKLQLALRHPTARYHLHHSQRIAEDFIGAIQREAGGLDACLAEMIEMGKDPRWDIPAPAPACAESEVGG